MSAKKKNERKSEPIRAGKQKQRWKGLIGGKGDPGQKASDFAATRRGEIVISPKGGMAQVPGWSRSRKGSLKRVLFVSEHLPITVHQAG